MRLTAHETSAIRDEVQKFDPNAEIILFGSRVDEKARGGDIDLLVISDRLSFRDVLRLRTSIFDQIGWQQLDLIVRKRNQPLDPLVSLARETGVRL